MIERDQGRFREACHCFAMSADAYHRIGASLSEATIRVYWGETCAAANALAEAVEHFRRAFALYQEFQEANTALEIPLWSRPYFG
jgi:hypothetical protein